MWTLNGETCTDMASGHASVVVAGGHGARAFSVSGNGALPGPSPVAAGSGAADRTPRDVWQLQWALGYLRLMPADQPVRDDSQHHPSAWACVQRIKSQGRAAASRFNHL